jgi:ribosome modulation factor
MVAAIKSECLAAMRWNPQLTQETELPQTVSDEGTDSFLKGLPRENCPYPPGSGERDAWLTGWDKAAMVATAAWQG